MRVYKREEFLKLPEGTIYAKGKEWFFNGLEVKFDTTDYGDWWSLDPCWIDADKEPQLWDRLDEMLDKGASYPMETAISRDGLSEEDAIFLVFEKDDLLKLQGYISKALELAQVEV
jgi:hypothetical protein